MRVKRLIDNLSHGFCAISSAAIAIMVILMVGDGISRKIFGSIPGGYNTTIALLTVVLFFSQGYAQMRRAHITVDLITSRLNQRTQAKLRIVTTILAIIVFAILTWAGGQKALYATRIKEEWMGAIFYPAWPFRWTIPIGLGLLTIQLIVTAVDDLKAVLRRV